MSNYQPNEQYLLEPEITEQLDFELLELRIEKNLLLALEDLKKANFAKIILMTKDEFKTITEGVNPTKIWKLIKKIKADAI